MKKQFLMSYEDVVSLNNLLSAWSEFLVGKRAKPEVQVFSLNLMDNILSLHSDLVNGDYQHDDYQDFYITDPKLRHIHKASIRDRLVHHAVYRSLYPFFDKIFIANSYSCRVDKGVHRAIKRFKTMAGRVSRNNNRTAWALKCDIRRCFDSVDQKIILEILDEYVVDKKIVQLLQKIIESFEINPGKGLPLGNLTSQLFVNIYLNKFDQFVKHKIKARHYLRYTDDFVLLSADRLWLSKQICLIENFLTNQLKLTIHPQKIFLQTIASGVDFLGWVNFSEHKVLRTRTKKRIMDRIKKNAKPETLASYLGLLKHGNTLRLQQEILNNYWLWGE